MKRPDEVVFHQLPAAGLAGNTSQDAGIGSGVDDPIHLGQRLEVTGIANVPVHKTNAMPLARLAILFAAGPAEVVEAQYFDAFDSAFEFEGDRTSSKSTDACNEHFHLRGRGAQKSILPVTRIFRTSVGSR